ncbi:MAG TPA: metal ABC transporter permease [Solirubrobacterales bacterium]
MLAHEFMRNAYLAGGFVALACGLVGYFVVLRGQVFAGDALSHVAFTGALAAAAAGVDVRLGIFVATIAGAAAMGLLGERARPDDVVIGSVFAWVLGLGALFLALFISGSSGADGTAAVRVLFGSILGLSAAEARLAAAIGLLAVLGTLALARPLLFASLDPEVAGSLGLPVRAVGAGFLVLLALVAAEATQAVGALLLLGLLAAPGGAARLLTDNPWRGLALSAALALAAMWGGLALSYLVPSVPASFAVIGLATAGFATAAIVAWRRSGGPSRTPVWPAGAGEGAH